MTTPQGTPLLNDDGSASVATAVMMSHHGLRRDIAEFGLALKRIADGAPWNVSALQEEWSNYRNTLHGHQEAEDKGLFAFLRGQHPDLAPTIEQLSSDHRLIDPLLERGDRAFADLQKAVNDAIAVISALSALLDPHLATEEAKLVPHLRSLKAFPPPATEAEIDMFAQGFAWSSHGVAPEVLERVFETLHPAVRAKLPGARAAFEERYARVWGSSKVGASRTSIPEWLADQA